MEDSQKQKFHMWTADEDKLLVECLMQLRIEQRFMADNGFKSGYANRLEAMMLERELFEIKEIPHIIAHQNDESGTASGIRYGVWANTSGFGWDADRQCVVADKEVWDEYIKVHKRAGTHETNAYPTSKICVSFGLKIGRSATTVNHQKAW
ncbi:hypothetical protein K1719_010763 [Acacia pycnantha]|nr:hypothetical protein K1719_010763 [Acacia pycnantha]